MARIHPITFRAREVNVVEDGGEIVRLKVMVPLARFGNLFGRQYHLDEDYTLVPLEPRSRASHNHYFAWLQDAFSNLPDKIAARFPTPEHLRRWALIETGWFDEKEFDCPDELFAKRLGTFLRAENEYARISVHRLDGGRFKLIVRVAKSQSAAAMSKQPFDESKKAVIELVSAMIGVSPATLRKEGGKSA